MGNIVDCKFIAQLKKQDNKFYLRMPKRGVTKRNFTKVDYLNFKFSYSQELSHVKLTKFTCQITHVWCVMSWIIKPIKLYVLNRVSSWTLNPSVEECKLKKKNEIKFSKVMNFIPSFWHEQFIEFSKEALWPSNLKPRKQTTYIDRNLDILVFFCTGNLRDPMFWQSVSNLGHVSLKTKDT